METADELREAYRVLKGSILRQEIYALDRRLDGRLTEESDRPYSASERNYTIEYVEPRGSNRLAIFFVHPRETIDFQYERKLSDIVVDATSGQSKKRADPRITHNLTLEIDEYGNPLRSMSIGYGRRHADQSLSQLDQERQAMTLITYTENNYTNAVLQHNDAYRTPVPSETRTFEVVKIEPLARLQDPSKAREITTLFLFQTLDDLTTKTTDFSQGKWDIPYSDIMHTQATENHPYRRLIEHTRMLYRGNALDRMLPLGSVEDLALPGEKYKLVFTPDLLDNVYQREGDGGQPPENLLPDPDRSIVLGSNATDGGGYVELDGDRQWWNPSGQVFYWQNVDDNPSQELDFAQNHFFLPHRFSDAFGKNTIISYDSNDSDPFENRNNLLLTKTQDPLNNIILVYNDYRILQPAAITDPNGAVSEIAFDALGFVIATAVHKGNLGDSLQNFQADITQKKIDDFFANPRQQDSNWARFSNELYCL